MMEDQFPQRSQMAVVVKTVLGSHFGVGAPPILEPLSLILKQICLKALGVFQAASSPWHKPLHRGLQAFRIKQDTAPFTVCCH